MSFYERKRDNINDFFFKGGNMSYPAHFHHGIELVYASEPSNLDITVNGKSMRFTGYEMAFIDSDDVHEFNDNLFSGCYGMVISENLCENYFKHKGERILKSNFITDRKFVEKIAPLFMQIPLIAYNPLAFRGAVDLLLALMSDQIGFKTTANANQDMAAEVMNYLKKHYSEKITLDIVAQKMGYNKCYLSKVINDNFDENFNNLLNSVRYKAFMEMQKERDDLLNNIFNAGFNSVSTFYRYCKTHNLPTKHEKTLSEINVRPN